MREASETNEEKKKIKSWAQGWLEIQTSVPEWEIKTGNGSA